MSDTPQLWEAARALYATALPDFVTARNELARELKRTGDAQAAQRVAAFKKPSVAADFVNRLVRDDGALADEIAQLGMTLREAQVDADATTLRGLDQERRELVNRSVAWARSEVEQRGGVASEAMLRDVEQTIWAAIVDARACATVQAGMLVRRLSPGGFGEVDVTGASALEVDAPDEPQRPSRRRTPAEKPARPTAAEVRAQREAAEALERAQTSSRLAQQHLEETAARTEAADARRAKLEAERERLRTELNTADRRLREARHEVSEAQVELRLAEKQRRSAAAATDRALHDVEQPADIKRADL